MPNSEKACPLISCVVMKDIYWVAIGTNIAYINDTPQVALTCA